MTPSVTVKVDRDHNPDPKMSYHRWSFARPEPRDVIGRRNPSVEAYGTRWLIFECINSECGGQVAVHPDVVTRLLPIHPANRKKAK